ncbi:MAG: HAD family hydrolase [Pseudobdellovibrionaceae bacterium]
MKYKDFSQSTWTQIKTLIEKTTASSPGPHYAAFDADGTLWDMDMGEAFFEYQINHCGLANMPADPWAYYQHEKEHGDTRKAYLWLAQINSGKTLEQVHDWSKDCLRRIPEVPVFPAQQKLIQYLQSLKVEIFVVTASIKWAVEPAAGLYGIDYDHVLGIETEVESGIVSERQKGLITWREGKAQKIKEVTGGKSPILACGNTMGDFHLLSIASPVSLAVSAAPKDHELYKTESELREKARENGWLSHSFI